METLKNTFVAPSGISYTIREQNGQDEEVLTNVGAANRFMNINNFLQGIIVESSVKPGKYTMDEILNIPLLDRQCILIQSRIFSLGNTLEFTYDWQGKDGKARKEEYELELSDYLLDYSKRDSITEEELLAKPDAIPFYPTPIQDLNALLTFTLASGKNIRFHILNGHSELYIMTLDQNNATRNTDLFARGLELQVEGKWEKVSNFSLFSTKDMRELRKLVNANDPQANLNTDVEDPVTGVKDLVNIMGVPTFFFPEEDV